jgi:NADH-quinone oxidoreductase subunit C
MIAPAALLETVQRLLGDALTGVEVVHGEAIATIKASAWETTACKLRDDPELKFEQLIDLCGVDYLTNPARVLPEGITPQRFELVVNMISHQPPRRIRLRLQVNAVDPTVPTLFDLFPGTENMEREAFDMFGIVFANHPDPTRILMPPDWDGHPLRKDFGVGSIPVQFKGAAAPR